MSIYNLSNLSTVATDTPWDVFEGINVIFTGGGIGLFILAGTFLVVFFSSRSAIPQVQANFAAAFFATSVIGILLRMLTWIPEVWLIISFVFLGLSVLWMWVDGG